MLASLGNASLPVMKILHVIASMNPKGGGPMEGITQMAAVHQRRGDTLSVVCLDDPSEDHIAAASFPVYALGKGIGKYRFNPRLFWWLRKNARNYDAVVINGIWQNHSYFASRALQASGVGYYVYTHGMLDPWFRATYPLKHLKKILYWNLAERKTIRDANAVLFTCEEERLLARTSFGNYSARERVVPYGSSSAPASLAEARDKFFKSYPALLKKRLVLFLGRVHEKKGCDIAIEALARVVDEHPNATLIIAGPGDAPTVAALQALILSRKIERHVFWTGMLVGDVKWGAFAASEVFVLPSHQENFGIAVAESLACGTPVIISDKVNIWREIEGAKAGLVGGDNISDTEKNLRSFLSMNSSDRMRMSESAKQLHADRFTVEKMTSGLLQAINDDR